MSDIYEKIVNDQDPFTKLLAKIPGFKGYVERGDRRMSDKLLRETISLQFESHYQRISALQRSLISQGGLAYVDDLESAAIKLRQFIDRIRTASYGYSAIFDAIKINSDELSQLYQYDVKLLDLNETVGRAIDNVEASIGSDGLPAAINNLIAVAQDCLQAFNQRSDLFKALPSK